MKLECKGYILLTTFIMMLVLSVMMISLMTYNTIQTRIAANAEDEQIAFQTAEGSLNQAINNLIKGVYSTGSFASNTGGLYVMNPNNTPLFNTVNWSNSAAVIFSYQGGSNSRGAFIIEELPPGIQPGQSMSTPTRVYRVTSRAVGPSGRSEIKLQSSLQMQE